MDRGMRRLLALGVLVLTLAGGAAGSPVITRRNLGIGTTSLTGLPVNVISTLDGGSTSPVLPCAPPPGWCSSCPVRSVSRSTGQ